MEKYNILYYKWNEVTFDDGVLCLKNLGHNVVVTDVAYEKYDNDEKFLSAIEKLIKDNNIELIFSFNYFPDLSRAAMNSKVRYVSWCFDSPHMSLNSITLGNPCNTVNIFDYAMYEKYKNMGIDTVRHMPLACNVDRVSSLLNQKFMGKMPEYQHDITFLGTLYEDEHNFFDQINYLPPYIKGYIDAAMEAQVPIYGMDMISYLLRDDICEEVFKNVKINIGPDYIDYRKDALISMIQKKITVTERRNLLTVLGENFKVDHYAGAKGQNIPVDFKGYASYMDEMPEIFATSKINLNISLRSILTGIPLRVIDILGAGGFCITNFQSELTNYFENEKSIVWYESYGDLFEKISYYFVNDKEREMIAKNGHEIVKDQFSYDVLFPKVLEA